MKMKLPVVSLTNEEFLSDLYSRFLEEGFREISVTDDNQLKEEAYSRFCSTFTLLQKKLYLDFESEQTAMQVIHMGQCFKAGYLTAYGLFRDFFLKQLPD